jgi:hypothetical protein
LTADDVDSKAAEPIVVAHSNELAAAYQDIQEEELQMKKHSSAKFPMTLEMFKSEMQSINQTNIVQLPLGQSTVQYQVKTSLQRNAILNPS